ncbi:hypothetical protein DENSPDRAFT_874334 [Dentipellis sp. KUC8613]|nr:hypothetical protein DENSPDRAFT_874334 [Dentipellis sp. KUC8613]
MAQTPGRFMSDVYSDYPDDNTTKEVQLQAAGRSYLGYGERHVLLQWPNGTDEEGDVIMQIVQLSGMVGNYAYYAPFATKCTESVLQNNEAFSLGMYSRAQRDRILALAEAIQFKRTSNVNNCQTWARDLLEAMVKEDLLSESTFDEIDKKAPLWKRQPEA